MLHGDHLICHGTDAKTVYEQAKAVGITTPFLDQVLEEEKGAVMGGWL